MIGVLALQGGFREHMEVLMKLGIATCEVRTREELMNEQLRGLILPGGESTVMAKFIYELGLREAICARAHDLETSAPFVIYGTCAGLILLSKNVTENSEISCDVRPLGLLDVDVERNAYGRQSESFVTDFGAFIRAPKITRVGENVEVVREYEGAPVLVRCGNIWGGTFHPELVGNVEVHRGIFGQR